MRNKLLIFISILEVALAKIMLALLFTLAPLFIGFSLFKPTYSFFDRWLGLIAGNAFLFIFISATLALVLNLVQWAIQDAYSEPTKIYILTLIPIFFVCFISIGLIFRVVHMAQSLGGDVTTISGNTLANIRHKYSKA